MGRRATGWTCQRQSDGKVCKYHNKPRTRKCAACAKPRPARRQPAHMAALDLDYEGFIALNGGEHCGICQRPPSGRRRLDRDHDHHTHLPRGLLCPRCNRQLASWVTPEWLRLAREYLRLAPARLELSRAAVSQAAPGAPIDH